MHSTFTGIEVGKRSLIGHTQGISTVGHNLSNQSTEGYSRQRVEFMPFEPIYFPALDRAETPGQLGQGMVTSRIERIRDELLENQIVAKAEGGGYWAAREFYLGMAEAVYTEPTESSVRSAFDNFWNSWQELSYHPEAMEGRMVVLENGQALVDRIHEEYRSLKSIQEMINEDVVATVNRINTLLSDIAGINEEITKIQALGDNPNDLMDRRDLLVGQLSTLVNITVDKRDPDELLIHSGGRHLLQGRVVHPIAAEDNPLNEGYARVLWVRTGEDTAFTGGRLASLLQLRDGDIREEIQKLDLLTVNFTDMVNAAHREAFGLNGKTGLNFFREYPFVNNVAGNYDQDGDGVYDSTRLFRISGTQTLDPREQIGLSGILTLSSSGGSQQIPYFPTDTVEDVIRRINLSSTEVVAALDQNGRLNLKATQAASMENPDFVIRHVEDQGQFLVGYAGLLQNGGPEGAYDWGMADARDRLRGNETGYAVSPTAHPSAWMVLNGDLLSDPSSLAAGFGVNGRPAEAGDGSAALAIAALRHSEVMLGRTPNFDEYFAGIAAQIGEKGKTAQRTLMTQEIIMKSLTDLRDSISGVNIDEEMAQMIKYQHGYNAAARFINVVNEMLDVIINRMGV
ncbi:MAG: flagellar hook-associated protein FlgK [Spirochaetales bacterium]|jgi:flagellar hook-associated protein 1 FlgK|nr:flagellar hook-associated protein FlgK [Spirochaetales bacterium]